MTWPIMAGPSIPAAILLSLMPAGHAPAGAAAREAPPPVELAQLTFHQRIVIRIPQLPDPSASRANIPDTAPARIVEKKGPKCVATGSIAGVSVTRADSVDLVTTDGRYRARFDDQCPALDFYRGFYLRQTSDGLLCADRDALRARSGGECRIKQFKRLVRRR